MASPDSERYDADTEYDLQALVLYDSIQPLRSRCIFLTAVLAAPSGGSVVVAKSL